VSCKGAPCPQELILPGVRWSRAYPLSTRQIAAWRLDRGGHVAPATSHRWGGPYRPQLAEACQRRPRPVSVSWRRDAPSLRVPGGGACRWRAVEQTGQTLDGLRTAQGAAHAAKRCRTPALRRYGVPEKRPMDGRAAHDAAIKSEHEEHGVVF
jgi:transposase-like protein